jgi:hypothetical protein
MAFAGRLLKPSAGWSSLVRGQIFSKGQPQYPRFTLITPYAPSFSTSRRLRVTLGKFYIRKLLQT